MRIKIARRQIATVILAGALLLLNTFMRYGIWKKMQYSNKDVTRYEKLALANHLKGQEGVDFELQSMAKHDYSSADFVSRTAARIKEAGDAKAYLKASMAADRKTIEDLRSRRFLISCFIYFVIGCQVLFNARCWWKDNKHHFNKA